MAELAHRAIIVHPDLLEFWDRVRPNVRAKNLLREWGRVIRVVFVDLATRGKVHVAIVRSPLTIVVSYRETADLEIAPIDFLVAACRQFFCLVRQIEKFA